MADERAIVEQFKHWALDPKRFVIEAFGMDGHDSAHTISPQQEDGLEFYRRILMAKLKRWRSPDELTIRERSDAERVGISVHSGHGTGKTAFAAWVLLHFLVTRPFCKVPCVAPVGPQLRTNLWPEVHLWIRRSPVLSNLVRWQAEKIYWKEGQGREWFAVPRTVNVKASPEEQAETLAGIHADNMLVIVDEASGVPDPVFRPLEGGLTGPCNFVLLIGNPTQSHGLFFDTFAGKERGDWFVCHWNAEESPLVQKSQIERMERKYGRDSNAYRIRVLGLPPLAAPDTLIPWDWVMAAVDRELFVDDTTPLVIGIDVAREVGGDKSIILRRQGGIVKSPLSEFEGLNTQELAYWALKEIQESNASAAAIDVIGWGAGTYDTLKDLAPIPVLPVNVAMSATNEELFTRLRDELWWQVRERFQEQTISIPPDDELIGELTTIKYNFQKTAKEKIKIESKQELRDRGLASPNKADALCLSEYAWRVTAPRPTRDFRRKQPRGVEWVG